MRKLLYSRPKPERGKAGVWQRPWSVRESEAAGSLTSEKRLVKATSYFGGAYVARSSLSSCLTNCPLLLKKSTVLFNPSSSETIGLQPNTRRTFSELRKVCRTSPSLAGPCTSGTSLRRIFVRLSKILFTDIPFPHPRLNTSLSPLFNTETFALTTSDTKT